jgi:multidrug resistance efflux pump
MRNLDHERKFPRIPLLLLIAAIVAPISLQADEPKAERVIMESRGHLVPASQITVSPKVAGQVVELLIDEGKQVKAGDVLARLDSEEYKAALLLARAKLKLAEARLAPNGCF